ncbi:MAG: cytochrome B5 [Nitrospinota bacterium]|nr:cytochrome B5 [Nitrospinota bacterium]
MGSSFRFPFLQALFICLLLPANLDAWPDYARGTKQGCNVCHLEKSVTLNPAGIDYAASGYKWPPSGGFWPIGPVDASALPIIGFLHIFTGVLWLGTILYVHIVLRPAYAEKGLPKTEVRLGIGSMIIVGITGILLTISRVRGWDVFTETTWGNLLAAKISIYLTLVLSGLFVVIFIGPKLRQSTGAARKPEDGKYDPVTLMEFDGNEGRPAYIAYMGKVYDVTDSNLWKRGTHFIHKAGEDLTSQISKAPHSDLKLKGMKEVGSYDTEYRHSLSLHQKLFHFIAYFNLFLVVVIFLIIAFWIWYR